MNILLKLHQTTTCSSWNNRKSKLNILLKLHQTTTVGYSLIDEVGWISFWNYIKPQRVRYYYESTESWISFWNYIKPQLSSHLSKFSAGWISFWNYIKPQLWSIDVIFNFVEYPFEITSNHNSRLTAYILIRLNILLKLHQTTTLGTIKK